MRTNELMAKAEKLFGTDRPYMVKGALRFECVSEDSEIDLEKVRQAIVEVEEKNPWKDISPRFKGDGVRGTYITPSQLVSFRTHGVPGIGKDFWFTIEPRANLRQSQLHAYEKYMAKLAEELAARRLDGIKSVSAKVDTVRLVGKFVS